MSRELTRKSYINRVLKSKRFTGSRLVLLGALCVLLWAISEWFIRWDAMDGLWKAYFNLAKKNDIPLLSAVKNLWDTKEARKDLIVLAFLALSAVFSAAVIVFHDFRRITIFTLIASAGIAAYDPYRSIWPLIFNLSTITRLGGCALMAVGSAIKLFSISAFKIKAGKKYDKRHLSNPSTRIPRRLNTGR